MTASELALLLLALTLPLASGAGERGESHERRRIIVQRLNDETLRAALKDGCALALVRVLAVDIVAPGTRSESASAELAVERVIHGEVGPSISAWAYTKADTLVRPNHRYIVVLGPGKLRLPLGELVEVPAGSEDEAVRVHHEAVERLRETVKPRGDDGR